MQQPLPKSFLLACLALSACSAAWGLELRADPLSSAAPSLAWSSADPPPKLTLYVRNDESVTQQLASVQIAIKLSPLGGAGAPPTLGVPTRPAGGLFDALSGPTSQQRGEWTVIEFSSFPVGPLLSASTAAPLVELPLEGIASAAGTFELVLGGFVAGQLPTSSYWISQSAFAGLAPFAPGSASSAGGQLLATLSVQPVPEPTAVAIVVSLLLLGAPARASRRSDRGRTTR